MPTPRVKLFYCVLGNLFALSLVIMAVVILEQDGQYVKFGPSDTMVVISVKINTWTRYGMLLLFTVVINVVKVISEEIGMPILSFNIYDPHRNHITGFTKFDLQVLANLMYAASAIRSVFMTMMLISQIDVALFGVFVKEATSIITIRALLNEKTFADIDDQDQAQELV
jgi:hypothetical protein